MVIQRIFPLGILFAFLAGMPSGIACSEQDMAKAIQESLKSLSFDEDARTARKLQEQVDAQVARALAEKDKEHQRSREHKRRAEQDAIAQVRREAADAALARRLAQEDEQDKKSRALGLQLQQQEERERKDREHKARNSSAPAQGAAVPGNNFKCTTTWLAVNRQGQDPTCAHRALFNLETYHACLHGKITVAERNKRLLAGLARFDERFIDGNVVRDHLKNVSWGSDIVNFSCLANLQKDIPLGIGCFAQDLLKVIDSIESLRRSPSGTLLFQIGSSEMVSYKRTIIAPNKYLFTIEDNNRGHASAVAITKHINGTYTCEVMEPHGEGEQQGTRGRVAYLVDLLGKQDLNKIREKIKTCQQVWETQRHEDMN